MLTAEQIAIVQKELETALPEGEMICIPQGKLYERLMDKIDMEQYQFCQTDYIFGYRNTGYCLL